MANYNFNLDIKLGELGEDEVIKDLEALGAKFVSNNKDNKFDVMMNINGVNILYEIKTDVFCRPENDTGNIFVEYQCRGKHSGLLVTKAKWFATYFKHLREIWYIQTDVLKGIIMDNEIGKTEFSGDAGSNTKGWLVPRYQYKKHFIVRKVPKEKS
jgi:hypothetical protein